MTAPAPFWYVLPTEVMGGILTCENAPTVVILEPKGHAYIVDGLQLLTKQLEHALTVVI